MLESVLLVLLRLPRLRLVRRETGPHPSERQPGEPHVHSSPCCDGVGLAVALPTMKADLDLCYLTAVQARERFRERSLSPVEFVTSLVARNRGDLVTWW